MTGLFRFLLLLFGFLFVRRVVRGWMRPSPVEPKVAPTSPDPTPPDEDLGEGQPIEDAEYEELD